MIREIKNLIALTLDLGQGGRLEQYIALSEGLLLIRQCTASKQLRIFGRNVLAALCSTL